MSRVDCSKCGVLLTQENSYKCTKTGKPMSPCRECRNEYNKSKWIKKGRKTATKEERILWGIKGRAKIKGIECTIVPTDIIIPKVCPVLGIPLHWEGTTGNCWNSPSVDRIDPNKGYIPGNILVMSQRANLLKSNGTLEEHRAIVKFMEESATLV